MRFCTTCGRNFEEDVDVCPHDGTPLFGSGDEEGEDQQEAQEQEAPETPQPQPEGVGVVEESDASIGEPAFDDVSDEGGPSALELLEGEEGEDPEVDAPADQEPVAEESADADPAAEADASTEKPVSAAAQGADQPPPEVDGGGDETDAPAMTSEDGVDPTVQNDFDEVADSVEERQHAGAEPAADGGQESEGDSPDLDALSANEMESGEEAPDEGETEAPDEPDLGELAANEA
ncbi:MAG: hypothetical protein ABEN55_08020, partial [Bradymonadaceae bacterium]